MNTISCAMWMPTDDVKGIVQIAHGMSEHIDRYSEFAEFMVSHGYVVCGNDHSGHGKSFIDKRGFMGTTEGDISMIKDMKNVHDIVKAQYSEAPYFLLGHSMGSFLARMYTAHYKDTLDGLIISGTSGTNYATSLGLLVCKINILLNRGYKPANIMHNFSFKTYNKKFPPSKTQPENEIGKTGTEKAKIEKIKTEKTRLVKAGAIKAEPKKTGYNWLSRDESVVDKYIEDDNCGFVFSFYGYRDMLSALKYVSSNECYEKFPSDLPIYIFSGLQDPVGNYGKGVIEVYDKLKKHGVKDVKMNLYQGGRHEMLNELNKDDVFADMLGWLNNIPGNRMPKKGLNV